MAALLNSLESNQKPAGFLSRLSMRLDDKGKSRTGTFQIVPLGLYCFPEISAMQSRFKLLKQDYCHSFWGQSGWVCTCRDFGKNPNGRLCFQSRAVRKILHHSGRCSADADLLTLGCPDEIAAVLKRSTLPPTWLLQNRSLPLQSRVTL